MLKKISIPFAVAAVIATVSMTATLANDSTNSSKGTSSQATQSPLNAKATESVKTFSDVSSDEWYAAAVGEAIKKKYVDGYEDGLFHAEKSVTRAEFLKMIVTGLGIKVAVGSGAEWYQQYVGAAVDKGFHKLEDFSGNDKYNQPITRQEMAKILICAVDPAFKDETDDKKLVYEAVKRGLIQGLPGGKLALGDATNRGQAVAVIERVLSAKQGTKLEVDKYALSAAEINWHKTNIATMLPRYFSNGIGEFKGNNFKADSLKFTADDGNFVNEIKELVVVDMSDPNDPNRVLVPDDLTWRGGDHQRKPVPDNSYAVLAVSHIKVGKKYGISPAYQFGIVIPDYMVPKDVDLKSAYANDPGTLIDAEMIASKSKGGDRAIEINYSGHEFDTLKEQDYITGFVIPKGSDLFAKSDPQVFTLTYQQSTDFGGKSIRLFESQLDPSIHQ